MSTLSEEYIIAAEQAILSDILVPKTSLVVPSISCQYYDEAEEAWKFIQNSQKNSYRQFASNALGMSSYGFYKANNGQIYIIEAWINEIRNVYIPSKNIDCLKNLINDEEDECKSSP